MLIWNEGVNARAIHSQVKTNSFQFLSQTEFEGKKTPLLDQYLHTNAKNGVDLS